MLSVFLLMLLLLAGRNRLEVDDGDENASTSTAVSSMRKSRVVALPMKTTTAASEANGDVVLPMIHFILQLSPREGYFEHICTIALQTKDFCSMNTYQNSGQSVGQDLNRGQNTRRIKRIENDGDFQRANSQSPKPTATAKQQSGVDTCY